MTSKSLSRILALDAVTCAAVFVLGVLATASLAALTSLPAPVLEAGGWICLAAALLLAYLALRPSRGLLWIAIAGNAAWVAASLALWAVTFPGLTGLGHAVIVAQAIGVAVFTLLEIRGAGALAGQAATA